MILPFTNCSQFFNFIFYLVRQILRRETVRLYMCLMTMELRNQKLSRAQNWIIWIGLEHYIDTKEKRKTLPLAMLASHEIAGPPRSSESHPRASKALSKKGSMSIAVKGVTKISSKPPVTRFLSFGIVFTTYSYFYSNLVPQSNFCSRI